MAVATISCNVALSAQLASCGGIDVMGLVKFIWPIHHVQGSRDKKGHLP